MNLEKAARLAIELADFVEKFKAPAGDGIIFVSVGKVAEGMHPSERLVHLRCHDGSENTVFVHETAVSHGRLMVDLAREHGPTVKVRLPREANDGSWWAEVLPSDLAIFRSSGDGTIDARWWQLSANCSDFIGGPAADDVSDPVNAVVAGRLRQLFAGFNRGQNADPREYILASEAAGQVAGYASAA